MSDKLKVGLVMLVAILLAAAGEALAAKGMKTTDPKAGLAAQLMTAAGDWHVWIGTLLMVGYVLLYVYTLSIADLSLALPLSAFSYLIGAFLSKYYLHEDVKLGRWIGTFIIIAGVMVVAATGLSDKATK